MVGYDPHSKDQLSQKAPVFAGAISGVGTRCLAQPLDVLKIRFQLHEKPISRYSVDSEYRSIYQTVTHIYKKEGVTAFWKGHVPAQALSVVFGVVQFSTFEIITKQVWNYLPPELTTEYRPFTHFVCGSLAGCVATVSAHPFDVIRTRFVAQRSKTYSSVSTAFSSIVQTEGALALYKGLVPALLQIAPNTGLQFGFYTLFSLMWTAAFGEDKDSQHAYLLAASRSLACGSGAGVCAKVTIYPLDLVKKRLQIQGFKGAYKSTQRYSGVFDCVWTIVRLEGMFGLYKGLAPSLIKASFTAGSTFFMYEQCLTAIKYFSNQPR